MRDSNLPMSIGTQQLKAIFETAVDCLVLIESNGVIAKINPAGAQLFGYTVGDLIGQKINILMPSPYSEKHDEYMEHYQKTGFTKVIGKGRDVVGKKKDGILFPCRLSVNEFQVQSKKCYAGIIHDLTFRKNQEEEILNLNNELKKKVNVKTQNLSTAIEQLKTSNQQLEKEINARKKVEAALRQREIELKSALVKEKELNDLKLNFVSMASHEFRTPLSTILSSTTLIEQYIQKGVPEKTDKHFGRVKSSIQHLTEVLDDFLSLTKLAEGKIPSVKERFMLSDFCQDFLETNQGLLHSQQRISKAMPEQDVELFLDKKLLHHILLNLFSNAIKYSKPNGVIYCNMKIIDNQLVMNIKDEGIGIPKNEQKHLFERFFRGSNAMNIKGTGLGLNIVKEYLEMMSGKISFVSKENEGTTFMISIPLTMKT